MENAKAPGLLVILNSPNTMNTVILQVSPNEVTSSESLNLLFEYSYDFTSVLIYIVHACKN